MFITFGDFTLLDQFSQPFEALTAEKIWRQVACNSP
jgi:hypothetical protein